MADRPPQPADGDNTKAQQRRLIWTLVGVGLLALGVLVACVLWIPRLLYPPLTETDIRNVSDAAKVQELEGARLKLQNDARTTLLQGLAAVLVLTGAGIGAVMTLRQIRVSQGQLQVTREQMEHTLKATQQQLVLAERGQVTDRYIRAVEQLGHEKAPVRLGALYSLESLAQDNPEYHQTVVDVFCAYLRMPYTPPVQNKPDAEQVEKAVPPVDDRERAPHPAPGQDPAQELQVRQTAQRLLATHLRLPPGTSGAADQRRRPSSRQVFWPDVSLDLTGAALVDLDFKEVSAVKAWFNGATFQGSARFHGATFHDDAEFDGATFQRGAWFNGATFHGNAWYNRATFQGNAWFSKATFQDAAGFAGATFQDSAWFAGATFQDSARFHGATFQRAAWFNGATFTGDNRGEGVAGAQVLRLDDSDLNERRVWPNGWTVRPDPADPTRGTLVRAEQMEEPEPAATPPNPLSR